MIGAVSGAVTISASFGHAEHFDVRDYGTFDDGKAVQAALNAAGAEGGGIVFLPPGTWTSGATLTFPEDKIVHLRGAGQFISVIDYTGSGIAVAIGDGTGCDWGSLSDLQVRSDTNAAVTLVKINNAHRGTIRRCCIYGHNDVVGSRGIHYQTAYTNSIETSIIGSVGIPVDLDGVCNDFTFKDVACASAIGPCIKVLNSANVRISGGQISNALVDYAIRVDGTDPSHLCLGFELRNVHFEGNEVGDLIIGDAATSSQFVYSPTIVGCPLPGGAKFDKAATPVVVGSVIGLWGAAKVLTLTPNVINAVLIGVQVSSNSSISDSGAGTARIGT